MFIEGNCARFHRLTKSNDFQGLYSLSGKIPDSKVRGANMGPIWGQQGPGGPHDGPMNLAI